MSWFKTLPICVSVYAFLFSLVRNQFLQVLLQRHSLICIFVYSYSDQSELCSDENWAMVMHQGNAFYRFQSLGSYHFFFPGFGSRARAWREKSWRSNHLPRVVWAGRAGREKQREKGNGRRCFFPFFPSASSICGSFLVQSLIIDLSIHAWLTTCNWTWVHREKFHCLIDY